MADRIAGFFEKHRVAMALLALLPILAAALVGIATAYLARLPDWYMHLGMWLLLCTYMLLEVRGFLHKKRVRSWFNAIILLLLGAFWIWILKSKIPAEKIVVDDSLANREPLPILWVPIVLLAWSIVVSFFLAVGVHLRRRLKPAATDSE